MTSVIGALCWFHEPAAALERLVRSLEGVVDELVCLDGPWQHFPHRHLRSPDDQAASLRETAAEIGLPLQLLGGDQLFDSQVAKRSLLYSTAAARGDWLLVVDGDEEIGHHDPALRQLLAATPLQVGSVPIRRVSSDPRRDLERSARRLFRTEHGLSVMETHNGIVTDDGLWLAGPRRIAKQPTVNCAPHLRILHHHQSRGEQRNNWSRRYYHTRARLRIEVH